MNRIHQHSFRYLLWKCITAFSWKIIAVLKQSRDLSHSCNNWTVDSPQTSHAPKAQTLPTVYRNHEVSIGVCIPHTVNLHVHVFASVHAVPDKSTPTWASQFNLYAFAPHSVWTYTKGQFMVSQNYFSWRAVWSHHNSNVFIVVPNGHIGRRRIKSWVSNTCVNNTGPRSLGAC